MSACPSRVLASSSSANVPGAGALCKGPCTWGSGGLESAPAATGSTARGREMRGTTSPSYAPSLPRPQPCSCPRVPNSCGGHAALGTPFLRLFPHQCPGGCSRCTPSRRHLLPRWSSTGGSQGSRRSCRGEVSRGCRNNGTHCHQRPPELWAASPSAVLSPPPPRSPPRPGLSRPHAPRAVPSSAPQGTSIPARRRRQRRRLLVGAAGIRVTGAHLFSSTCSRPAGHRHWPASQELCRRSWSANALSSSQAASLWEQGSAQPRRTPTCTQGGRRGWAGAWQRGREAAGKVLTCRGF